MELRSRVRIVRNCRSQFDASGLYAMVKAGGVLLSCWSEKKLWQNGEKGFPNSLHTSGVCE